MSNEKEVRIAKIQLWCTVFQSVAVVITFVFLTLQTISSNKALEQTNKALRSSSAEKISDFMTDMNLLLINDSELQELFDWKKSDLLAFIFINNFNEWYHNYHEGLISDKEWENSENLIHMTSNLPWVKKILQTYYKENNQLHADYRQYLIQCKILQN